MFDHPLFTLPLNSHFVYIVYMSNGLIVGVLTDVYIIPTLLPSSPRPPLRGLSDGIALIHVDDGCWTDHFRVYILSSTALNSNCFSNNETGHPRKIALQLRQHLICIFIARLGSYLMYDPLFRYGNDTIKTATGRHTIQCATLSTASWRRWQNYWHCYCYVRYGLCNLAKRKVSW